MVSLSRRPFQMHRRHTQRKPVTKLGRLVKDGKIKSMEEIYLFSLPVKEYQIVDFFLPKLKDEVMKVRHWRCISLRIRQHRQHYEPLPPSILRDQLFWD